MKKFILVDVIDKATGELVGVHMCVSKEEVKECYSDKYMVYTTLCNKRQALKSLKNFRRMLAIYNR